MTLLIDNYDSFTYNLYQFISEIYPDIRVIRNDKIAIEEIKNLDPEYIVISPGPKKPSDAGLSKSIIQKFGGKTKILGVCLGHQCINEVFGGNTVKANRVVHGKTSTIMHDGRTLFDGVPQNFKAARYHSLVADKSTFNQEQIEVSAWLEDGTIMGLRHKTLPIEGIQFHPESFLTEYGKKLLSNFYNIN